MSTSRSALAFLLLLGLVVLPATRSWGPTMAEYALLLVFVEAGGPTAQYEVCGYNTAEDTQPLIVEFVPSNRLLAVERTVIDLEPGAVECKVFEPVETGVLRQVFRDHPPGLIDNSGSDTVVDPGTDNTCQARQFPVATQVFQLDETGQRDVYIPGLGIPAGGLFTGAERL